MKKLNCSATSKESFHARLAEEMRAARQLAGISQEKMATKIGVARTSVVNMERVLSGSVRQRVGTHRLALWSLACGLKATTILSRATR